MRALGVLFGLALVSSLLPCPVHAQTKRFGDLHRMLPWDADETRAVALGDVDGDGDLDAFIGNGNWAQQDRLYLNDGSGVFTDATSQLPAIVGYTLALALGDVDGDGDLDVLFGGGQNRLYLNSGSGVFTDATSQLPAIIGYTLAVALGDVEGDGDLDAFLSSGGQKRLYLNNGSGVFTDATSQLPAIFDYTQAVALGDVDGDGDLDALIGNGGGYGEQNRLYLNNGSGFFTDATPQLPAILDNTKALALGDMDGDGDLDALVGNGLSFSSGDQSRLYLNNGSGIFTDATAQFPTYFNDIQALALGDVDGDGDLDVMAGMYGTLIRLYLNNGSGVFTNATSQLPTISLVTRALALGDVDGDGDVDAVIGNGIIGGGGRQNRLYLNNGSGVFTDATSQPPVTNDLPGALALGDVDGDGDLDVLIGNGAYFIGQQNRLYLNNGSGVFTDATSQLPAILDYTQAVALGDVDGDGDLDAWIGNTGPPPGPPNRLYLNNGTGLFTDATSQLPAIPAYTRALALGDVDGDGDLDTLIGNEGQQNRLYLNNGSGFFTDATSQLPPIVDSTTALALGDVDGDGDLDALIGKYYGQQDRLYLNNGSGVFTDGTSQLPAIIGYTLALALGDVDVDGDLDVLFGGGQNRLYLNNGSGVFTDATSQLPLGGASALALGDMDGDGDLDALTGTGGQERLYLNNGSGFFTDATSQLPAILDSTKALALGEVDGDDDLDAMIVNGGQNRLPVANLTRQLAWRGIPRIGKPLTMDVYGPASGAWFMAISTGTANIPLPPVGTLRLDPTHLYLVFAGLLGPDGRASWTAPVPANPSLIGNSFYWQAIVAGPGRFTNLEVTTFTNL